MTDGKLFRDSIASAANAMQNERENINALNIFPVPDGDTGTNMCMTIAAAAKALDRLSDDLTVGEAADVAAKAMLRGARGNSGVILSLIFGGIAEGLRGCDTLNPTVLAASLQLGKTRAYKAVMNPSEGTILTVIRFAAEAAQEQASAGADELGIWKAVCEASRGALEQTQFMLPILRRAKVVDAGGRGLVTIFDAMLSVASGEGIVELRDAAGAVAPVPVDDAGTLREGADIKYRYCTEFLIDKNDGADAEMLRVYLESVGDCVVVVDDGEIIKVHCHSNVPGEVISRALALGELVNVKIDNMSRQHRRASWGADQDGLVSEPERKIAPAEKKYGFVSIFCGDGFADIFAELGADRTVNGGQTMNPSTEEILAAVDSVPAEVVFILPNNKNIIMAAKSAAKLSKKKAVVIGTKTVPQGIAAMISFDAELGAEENSKQMARAAAGIGDVSVTYAARDSKVGLNEIKQGEIMAMENGKITEIGTAPVETAFEAVRHLAKRDSSVITIYYGEGMTEQGAGELKKKLEAKFPHTEILTVYGGQPIYYFIISVE